MQSIVFHPIMGSAIQPLLEHTEVIKPEAHLLPTYIIRGATSIEASNKLGNKIEQLFPIVKGNEARKSLDATQIKWLEAEQSFQSFMYPIISHLVSVLNVNILVGLQDSHDPFEKLQGISCHHLCGQAEPVLARSLEPMPFKKQACHLDLILEMIVSTDEHPQLTSEISGGKIELNKTDILIRDATQKCTHTVMGSRAWVISIHMQVFTNDSENIEKEIRDYLAKT